MLNGCSQQPWLPGPGCFAGEVSDGPCDETLIVKQASGCMTWQLPTSAVPLLMLVFNMPAVCGTGLHDTYLDLLPTLFLKATVYFCCAYTDYTDQGFLTLSPSVNSQLSIDFAKWPSEEYWVQIPSATQEKRLDEDMRERDLWRSLCFYTGVVVFLVHACTNPSRSEYNTCCQNLSYRKFI